MIQKTDSVIPRSMYSVTTPEALVCKLARAQKSGEGAETFQVLPWER